MVRGGGEEAGGLEGCEVGVGVGDRGGGAGEGRGQGMWSRAPGVRAVAQGYGLGLQV